MFDNQYRIIYTYSHVGIRMHQVIEAPVVLLHTHPVPPLMLWGEERLRCKVHLQHLQVDGRHVKLGDVYMCHCLRLTCPMLCSLPRLYQKESLSETKADCLHNRNPLWKLPSSTLRMSNSQRQVLLDIFASHFLPHTFPPWASVDQNTQKSTACRFYTLNRANKHAYL